MKLLTYIKNNKYLTLLLVSILSVLLIYYLIQRNSTSSQNTPKYQIVKYSNLTLGISTRNDVIKEIGQPQKEYDEGQFKYLEYETSNPNFNDIFKFKSGSLTYIKKIIPLNDNTTFSEMVEKHGIAEAILYGPGSSIGLYLYSYPTQGIAFLGHQVSGLLTEIWYFEPTNYEFFRQNYTDGYSDNLDIHQ